MAGWRSYARLKAALTACALGVGVLAAGAVDAAPAKAAPAKPAATAKARASAKARAAAKAAKPAAPVPSEMVTRFAARVVANHDNVGQVFVVLDKGQAALFVFNPDGGLKAATPALIGLAPGDHSVPGIGDRELAKITAEERTTPAGRFLTSFRPNGGKRRTLWVDYDTAIAIHPLRELTKAASKQARLKRLKTATPDDNRITLGCINVSDAFYDEVVRPAFKGTFGYVYVLPDTQSLHEVFPTLVADGETTAAGAK